MNRWVLKNGNHFSRNANFCCNRPLHSLAIAHFMEEKFEIKKQGCRLWHLFNSIGGKSSLWSSGLYGNWNNSSKLVRRSRKLLAIAGGSSQQLGY